MFDLSTMNPPQREAVLHTEGPLVVFAGAGSGKTRVITHRVAYLVRERQVSPGSVLAVTFTNKAAGEMRERLFPLVGRAARELHVGTFHATCARLLREYADRIGLRKDFVIYDDQDQQAMIKRILRDLEIDEKRYPPKQIASRINSAKNEMATSIDGRDPTSEVARKVFALYEERMRAASALDFGDLIYRLVLALEHDPELRRELSDRFRYILVDEFQDTNHAQFRLVRALCATHENLCVVGDDDQSIYRWRGADRRNILDFRRAFPSAHVIKLEQNYRSSQRILRVAHEVIRRNQDREPKRMWTDNDEGTKVLVVRTEDERAEAQMVVRGVRQLLDDGHSLAEVAVFYRTHAQSRVLEEALRAASVPYKVVGGMRFYERAEVKDLLAYLRLIQNPADDVSCLRIVNVPARGVGKTTLDKVLDHAARSGEPVLATLRSLASGAELPSAARSKIAAFVALIDGFRRDVEKGESVAVLARDIVEKTGYEAVLRAEDTPEADARLENLSELVGSIAQYEAESDVPTLAGFLERVTLDTEVEETAGQDRVTLMTVHAAKGLEFDTVMVTGLEEQMFPYRGLDAGADPDELEEERRLAYVAFTRARQRLVLSHAALRRLFGQARVGIPSRFLDELPAADVEQIDTRPRPVLGARASYGGSGGYGGSSYGGGSYGGGSYGGRGGHEREAYDAHPSYDAFEAPRTAARTGSGESYVDSSDAHDVPEGGALRKGMRVRHPKFGIGEVREVSPGMPPKVTVAFREVGTKTVVATYLAPA
ncbi:MAG: UvrD-helicase domain-containing protein [Polyangiales bacterium]